MSSNVSPDASVLVPWQDRPARRGRAARKGDHYDTKQSVAKELTDCGLQAVDRGEVYG